MLSAASNPINIEAFKLVLAMANPTLNVVMRYWAESFFVVLPLLVLYFYLRKDKNVFSFVVAGVVLFLISDTIKMITKEPRPCEVSSLSWINVVACEGGYSFPSNHAMTLTGLAIFTKNYKYLRVLYVAWLLVILFGRVYTGAHYLTDVIAGVALSIVVAWIIYSKRRQINGFLAKIACRILPPLFPKEFMA